jgi:hypothetical protein
MVVRERIEEAHWLYPDAAEAGGTLRYTGLPSQPDFVSGRLARSNAEVGAS